MDAGSGACPGRGVLGDEVLFIGDGFLGGTHPVASFVETLARDAGTLGADERYRDKSTVRDSALALGGRNGIAEQYMAALEDGPVEVLIMDGGGTDLAASLCGGEFADCKSLVEANRAAAELLAMAAADGVGDVVYVFYPDTENDLLDAKLGALRDLIEGTCSQSPLPCHFLDLRPTFDGRMQEFASPRGPTAAGAEATAEAIWRLLQDRCIAP